jgi:hypothetical protein
MLLVARAVLMNPWSLLLLCAVLAPIAFSPAARRTALLLAVALRGRGFAAFRPANAAPDLPLHPALRSSRRRANLRLVLECQRLC